MWVSGSWDVRKTRITLQKSDSRRRDAPTELALSKEELFCRRKLKSNTITVALFYSTLQRKIRIFQCFMRRWGSALTMVTTVHGRPQMRSRERARAWKNTGGLAEDGDSDVSKQAAHKETSLYLWKGEAKRKNKKQGVLLTGNLLKRTSDPHLSGASDGEWELNVIWKRGKWKPVSSPESMGWVFDLEGHGVPVLCPL